MLVVTLQAENRDLFVGDAVTSALFGGNYLFNRESFQEGVADGAFDETAEFLGIRHVRYPGGTIAETQFNLANPDNTRQETNLITGAVIANTAQHELTPLSEFLAYADAADVSVTVVLPTAQYLDAILQGGAALTAAEVEIKRFIVDLMSRPEAGQVELLELGNEWASIGLTATEYGRIANLMAVWVDEALGAFSGPHPGIAVQLSQRGARLDETDAILSELSAEARDAIDSVILHNYRSTPWQESGKTEDKFSHVAHAEQVFGREMDIVMSEWNVGNKSANDGLLQGAGILEMFNQHLRLGADIAHIWPLFENNSTRLAADVVDAGVPADLMIGGEIFRQMTVSLTGMRVLDIAPYLQLDDDVDADALVHAYAADDQGGAVVFVSSLEGTALDLTLDLSAIGALVGQSGHLWMTRTSVADGVDPIAPNALPETHAISVTPGDVLEVALAPYEIVRFEYAGFGVPLAVTEDTDGIQDMRLAGGPDVVVLANDGARDLVRGFEPGRDRLDISDWGIAQLDDLTIRNLLRKDGSVSWIEIRDLSGDAEVLLRLADAPLDAARLTAKDFIFAATAAPPPIDPGGPDTLGLDSIRATAAGEIFRLADDAERDVLRDFDLGRDKLDVSIWEATRFEDLELKNILRKDGSVNWVEVRDTTGQAELVFRFAGAPLDAASVTADSFLFAQAGDPDPATPRLVGTGAVDDLRGTDVAEVFQMQDDDLLDTIRNFRQGSDLIDVRAYGARNFEDLHVSDAIRADGSVSWIMVSDATGSEEFLLRFDQGKALSAAALTAEDFVFL